MYLLTDIYRLFFLISTLSLFSCIKDSDSKLVDKVSSRISKNSTTVCPTDFDVFFELFSKDSVYQKSRVKYPLRYEFSSSETAYQDTEVEFIKSESEFNYQDFTKDSLAMQREVDAYTVKKVKTDEGIEYSQLGYDNGIHVVYKFKMSNGCWNLVKIEDHST